MNVARHGRRSPPATVAWLVAVALLAFTPPPRLAAQTRGPARIDVSPELVSVLVGALVQEPASNDGATERLLAGLSADPLVTAVLSELGASNLTPSQALVPTPWEVERLQSALAGGAPSWLAEAIQISVDHDLPIVTPLNVLVVLLRHPDEATNAFLNRHGLHGPGVLDFAVEVLQDLGESLGI